MLRSVMPAQTAFVEERGDTVQDAFGLLDGRCLFILVIVDDPVEETGRRKLFRITDNHNLPATGNGPQGILRLHLGCLIHDDKIEFDLARGEILSDRHRPHHETGLQGDKCVSGTLNQLSERDVSFLFPHSRCSKANSVKSLALAPVEPGGTGF